MHSSLWISALLVVPLLGALAAVTLGRRGSRAYVIGLVTSVVELGLAGAVALLYNNHVAQAGGFDFFTRHVLAAPFGLSYDVAIDGLSVWLVVLAAIVMLLALWGGRERRREPTFVAWLLLLTSFVIGSFVSHDLLEFFIFFELTLIPSYFLIAGWGGAERARAALKFFVYTFAGSASLLIGILYLGFHYQHVTGLPLSFDYGVLTSTPLDKGASIWIFAAFAVAFAVKAPLWPFHTWSPLTYAEAPTAASMDLSAVLAKLGSYGMLRFAVGLFPTALPSVRPVMMSLAVIGILYGSFLAVTAKDLKRLVAYSSLAQMGFIMLGIFSGSSIALSGAVLLMFNHGVITAGFFLLIGWIEQRRGSIQIRDLVGLQRPAPVMAGLFTVVMLASIGLPGLSGFVSEYLVLIGTFGTHPWWAVVGALGVIAAAMYLLWAYQRVFHGAASGPNAQMSDTTTRERWVFVPIVALIVVLGVYPRPVLAKIAPSVQQFTSIVAPSGVNQ